LRTQTYFNEPLRKIDAPCPGIGATGILPEKWLLRHQVIDRYNARKCEFCGFESDDQREFEIHHIRKLADVRKKYTKRGAVMPPWAQTMSAMKRKTLVVCKSCHHKIHLGKMDKSLKGTLENEIAQRIES
jgi:hypothetical protein